LLGDRIVYPEPIYTMDIELFLKTPKNGLVQALLWFCSSAHVIRDGSFSQYLSGVDPSADG